MKEITLSKGLKTLVDDEDYGKLSLLKWHYCPKAGVSHSTYINRRPGRLLMHRYITGAPRGFVVDHEDGDKLNNRKSNLRVCTQGDNVCNQRTQARAKSSQYKGVCWDKSKRKWVAQVKYRGKSIYLGRFDDETKAAQAYNEAATQIFGRYARPNILVKLDI